MPATQFARRCDYTLRNALQGGGNSRYTLRYDDECTDGWGFPVVLAKLPLLPTDGHPAGIITAFRLDAEPAALKSIG